MANNCLIKEVKGVIDNNSLDKFGFFTIHVCNTSGTTYRPTFISSAGQSYNFPVGSYIKGEGTFTTGKKIVESEDDAYVPANSSFDVAIPKYDYMIVSESSRQGRTSIFSINYDEYAYLGNFSINDLVPLYITDTPDGRKNSGDIINAIKHINKITAVYGENSNCSLNINDPIVGQHFYRDNKSLSNNPLITGNVETLISNMIQSKKDYFAPLSMQMVIDVGNTGCVSAYFTDLYLTLTFNGTSSVTITGGQISVTYDMDEDSFTQVNN